MATAIIRPNSDITMVHTCSSGGTGYLMINEVNSDGDTTTISQSANTSSVAVLVSEFGLGSMGVSNHIHITGITTTVVARHNGRQSTANVKSKVYINNVCGSENIFKLSSSGHTTYTGNTPTSSYTELFEKNNLIFNTTKQDISFKIDVTTELSASNGNKNTAYLYITQVFVTIGYEIVTPVNVDFETYGKGGITPMELEYGYKGFPYKLKINPNSQDFNIKVIDNGSNVSDSVVEVSEDNITIAKPSDVTYGFVNEVFNNINYYRAENKGVGNSLGKMRITFTVDSGSVGNINIGYINYAEATYDYMAFGKIDTNIGTTSSITSSNCQHMCNTSGDNVSNEQTITYSNISAGEHFIEIGYRKDSATSSNYDAGYFRIISTSGMKTEYKYHLYTINNVQEDHHIITEIDTHIYLKKNGEWKKYNNFFKKTNGNWKEISVKEFKEIFNGKLFIN